MKKMNKEMTAATDKMQDKKDSKGMMKKGMPMKKGMMKKDGKRGY